MPSASLSLYIQHVLAMEQIWKTETFSWGIQEEAGLPRKAMTLLDYSEITEWDWILSLLPGRLYSVKKKIRTIASNMKKLYIDSMWKLECK